MGMGMGMGLSALSEVFKWAETISGDCHVLDKYPGFGGF
jgi:hypothetical protein